MNLVFSGYSENLSTPITYDVVKLLIYVGDFRISNALTAEFLTAVSSGICNLRRINCGYSIRTGHRPTINSPVNPEIHRDEWYVDYEGEKFPS